MEVYLIYIAVFSCIAFIAYAVDKKKAQKGKWRIPEATLLSLSFFGGAIGGYLAMHVARHKTKKWKFHLVNLLGLAWQIAVGILLFQAL
jgi:uncharacterized membrane protein YsdA (DUF1294 family)